MNICLLLIITLILVTLCLHKNQIKTYEGFTRKFFEFRAVTYFLGISQAESISNEYTLIKTITKMSPFPIDIKLIADSLDRYNQLNNNNIQFILTHTNTIFGILYRLSRDKQLSTFNTDNLRFVAAFNDVPINIITYHINIHDLGDLKKLPFKPRINVGSRYSSDYFATIDILLTYGIDIANDIIMTYYVANEIYDHYGVDIDIIIHIASHPDLSIAHLTNKKLSKFVNLNQLNNGNIYEITLKEQPFYTSHNYYYKYGIDKTVLSKYYPHVVTYDLNYDPDRHNIVDSHLIESVNTISVKNNLISNNKVSPAFIERYLYNIYLNLSQINALTFVENKLSPIDQNDFLLPVPIHDGARNFYIREGIFKYTTDRGCALIDGRCSPQELEKHHLVSAWKNFKNDKYANARGNVNNLFLIS